MSDWKCANCGQPSSYQGHYSNLDGRGFRFSCGDEPVIGTSNWVLKKLDALEDAIRRGYLDSALNIVGDLRKSH
jgi:hypothetical protein